MMEKNGQFKEKKEMSEQRKDVKKNGKKKGGCINILIVQAGYDGKKWTI